jgi:hypothetical protein
LVVVLVLAVVASIVVWREAPVVVTN